MVSVFLPAVSLVPISKAILFVAELGVPSRMELGPDPNPGELAASFAKKAFTSGGDDDDPEKFFDEDGNDHVDRVSFIATTAPTPLLFPVNLTMTPIQQKTGTGKWLMACIREFFYSH